MLHAPNQYAPTPVLVKLRQLGPQPSPERFAIGKTSLAGHLLRIRELLSHEPLTLAFNRWHRSKRLERLGYGTVAGLFLDPQDLAVDPRLDGDQLARQ